MHNFLENTANFASIATAIVAMGAAFLYWRDRSKKQKRLEEYLKQRKVDDKPMASAIDTV